MRYRKISKIPFYANSIRNRILRQKFALKYLDLIKNDKIILNIDETWIGETDYRRRKWRLAGAKNSVSTAYVSPRLSVILGLDTLGNLYVSIT